MAEASSDYQEAVGWMATSDACTQDHSERAVDDDDDQVVLGRHSGLGKGKFLLDLSTA